MITAAGWVVGLDTLAAMISGSRLPPGQRALAYVKAQGGTKEACVPGSRIVTEYLEKAGIPVDVSVVENFLERRN